MRVCPPPRRKAGSVRGAIVIRMLASTGLLLTTGCTSMVLDKYLAESMTDPLYVWGVDYEQPEIQVIWSRDQPAKADAETSGESRPDGKRLSIRPELEGCDFVEVYVNDSMSPLRDGDASVQRWTIETDADVVPDDRYPDCSLLLTYRRTEPSQELVLVAATRDGVVAEFPSGKRKPAWLLLMPLAAIPDAALVASVVSWPLLYLFAN